MAHPQSIQHIRNCRTRCAGGELAEESQHKATFFSSVETAQTENFTEHRGYGCNDFATRSHGDAVETDAFNEVGGGVPIAVGLCWCGACTNCDGVGDDARSAVIAVLMPR